MRPPIEFIKKENKKNVIIFIHGFTGGIETWKNSNGRSLPEMLLEEALIIENCDIGYFNYFTEIIDFKKTRMSMGIIRTIFGKNSNYQKNMSIKDLSDLLRSSIEIYCEEYENIVLIAHSMGGLISKSFILKDLTENNSTKVKLFLSLAVPHKGSDWANIGEKLAKNNPQIIDLKPESLFLDDVTQRWIEQKECVPKTIYFLGQFDEIVEQKNAISYQVEKQYKVVCTNDHFNISKPETKEEIVYQGIKKYLEKLIKTITFEEAMGTKHYADSGVLDDEIFVLKLLIADIHNSLVEDAKQTFFDAEYMVREIISKGFSIDDLDNLYKNIERLYLINFAKFMDGQIQTSTQLITSIFESIIDRDRTFLKTAIPFIEANKKTGMLHQLANNLEKDIWWAKNQSIKDIEQFRKVRDKIEE